MPNLGAILKEEIRRLARKEVKSQLVEMRQLLARQRRDIATLKRSVAALERGAQSVASEPKASGEPSINVRFSRRSVKAQRRRLGLSAQEYGRLVGVSGLTIYNWEQGKSRPRAAQMAALVGVRNIGRREAKARLLSANGSLEARL